LPVPVPTMTTTLAFRPLAEWSLWLELRLHGAAPAGAEPVGLTDLENLRAESWWETRARRGALDEPREDFEPQVAPVPQFPERGPEHGNTGLLLEADDPSGNRVRCVVTARAFDPLATRLLERWLKEGGSPRAALDQARFHLCAAPVDPAVPEQQDDEADLILGVATQRPLQIQRRPLAPLLHGARHKAQGNPDVFPVFYTRHARREAEDISRRGAASSPPVETGGLLLGYLCSCPDSGEAFAVVTEVLAADAPGTTFSLSISPDTWATAQQRCEGAPGLRTPGLRILGQAHGHNFRPQDLQPESPEAAAQVSSDTAFLSADDRTWARAVFHAQPWQLSHVFGLDGDGARHEAFYGQRGGLLIERGYALIDDFDPHPSDR
jgi:hypothetical protein